MSIDDKCWLLDKHDLYYCKLADVNCEFQSQYKIPYAHNGNIGGRAYECLNPKKTYDEGKLK